MDYRNLRPRVLQVIVVVARRQYRIDHCDDRADLRDAEPRGYELNGVGQHDQHAVCELLKGVALVRWQAEGPVRAVNGRHPCFSGPFHGGRRAKSDQVEGLQVIDGNPFGKRALSVDDRKVCAGQGDGQARRARGEDLIRHESDRQATTSDDHAAAGSRRIRQVSLVDPPGSIVRIPIPILWKCAVLVEADNDLEVGRQPFVNGLQESLISAVASTEEAGDSAA